MPEGFDYDPEAVRAYAEVFTQAGAQVDQLRATLGRTSANAADLGNAWPHHGAGFETWMAALAEDLGNLSRHLGEVGEQLQRGTDLVVQADTTGLANLGAIPGSAE